MRVSRELTEKTEENNENFKTAGNLTEIQTVYVPNASLEWFRYVNLRR
jgi:hypothetical protein